MLFELAAVKLRRQSIHPLDANLNTLTRGPTYNDAALPEQALSCLSFGEDHITKLDLSRSKFLLVSLQPSLIVLYEEVAGLTMREEGGA